MLIAMTHQIQSMKIKIITIALVSSVSFLAACSGNHAATSGKDTNSNTYGAAKDTTKADTSKITSPDHTSSGGTDLVKDTTKKDTAKGKPKK